MISKPQWTGKNNRLVATKVLTLVIKSSRSPYGYDQQVIMKVIYLVHLLYDNQAT